MNNRFIFTSVLRIPVRCPASDAFVAIAGIRESGWFIGSRPKLAPL